MTEGRNTYEKIEAAVAQYQSGDPEGAETLLLCLRPYLLKYLALLKNGLIDLNDKEMRDFISLFIASPEHRKALVRRYQPREARAAAYSAAGMLARIYENISEDDIKQDLTVCLLILAKRYRKSKRRKKLNFLGYLSNAFQYELHRCIKASVSDPLAFRAPDNICYDDEQYVAQEEESPISSIISDDEIWADPERDDPYGINWVRGLTASGPFAEMTSTERKILRMYYIEKMSDREISEEIGWHINTINSRRRKLVAKLASYDNVKEA